MNSMIRVIQKIDTINDLVGRFAKYLLLFMAGALIYEVIARYIFNSPTIWVWDSCKHALCYLGALGGGYAYLYNAHVRVDVLYANWGVKTRAVVDIITSLLFFLFIIVLLWKSIEMAKGSWTMQERATSVLAPPLYYIKTAIPIGTFLLLMQGIAKLLRDIIAFITGVEIPGKQMDFT